MAKTAAPRKAPKSMAPTEPTLSWNLEGEAALKLLGVELAEVAVELPEEAVEAAEEPLMVDPKAELLELAALVTEAEDALPEELAEADVDDADVEVLVAEAIAKSPVLPRTSLMLLISTASSW